MQIWQPVGDILNQSPIGSDIICMVKRPALAVVQEMVCGDQVNVRESAGKELDWGVL